MDLITIALTAAQFVPGLLRLLKGEHAGEVAQKVVDAAGVITGIADPGKAIETVQANAELQLKLQQALAPVLIAQYEAETRQLEAVNQTMRAELASEDKYVKRWRPTLGYAVTVTWFLQMGALSVIIVLKPDKAAEIITAMGSLAVMWGFALSVLGVSVAARSKDKQLVAGQTPEPGILGALAQRLAGGK